MGKPVRHNPVRLMAKVEICVYLDEDTYAKLDDEACETFGSLVEDALEGPIQAAVDHAKASLAKEPAMPAGSAAAMQITVRGL
jgi:hypothetical protein